MKTALFIGSFVMLLCSCKKDWSCECTTTDNNGRIMSTSVGKIHDTKSKAQQTCGASSVAGGSGSSWSTSCELK